MTERTQCWVSRIDLLLHVAVLIVASVMIVQLSGLEKQLRRLSDGVEYVMSHDGDIKAIRDKLERIEDSISRVVP